MRLPELKTAYRHQKDAVGSKGKDVESTSSPRDDRSVALLAGGVFLFVLLMIRANPSIRHPDNHLRLIVQKNHNLTVACSATGWDEKSRQDIPATLTPLFFASVPINNASWNLLQTIKGIGPHLATEIIRARRLYGRFHNPKDLERVKGIGPMKMLRFGKEFSYR